MARRAAGASAPQSGRGTAGGTGRRIVDSAKFSGGHSFQTNPLDDPAADYPVVYSRRLSTFPVEAGTPTVVSKEQARRLVEDTWTFRKPGPVRYTLRNVVMTSSSDDAANPRLAWVVTWRGGTPAFHSPAAADQVDCIAVVVVDAITGTPLGNRYQFCCDRARPPGA
jgi:hypothetical protein